MGNCLIGYRNAVVTGQIAAGSEQSALPASNLGTPHGDTASAWQTMNGATRYINGARFSIDSLSEATRWRAFVLTGTNLSSAALLRWRVGPAEAIIEPGAPAIDIDFTAGDSFTAPATGTWSFTRTSPAWRCNALGAWEEVTSGTPRIHYNPWTLRRQGLYVEPSSTNRIRNPRGEGLVAPATPPTNMAGATTGGLSLTWVGTGTEGGIPGFYIAVAGAVAAGATARVYLETASAIAATVGQIVPVSAFIWRKSGSIIAITPALGFEERDGSSNLLATRISAPLYYESSIGTGRAGASRRFFRGVTGASTASVRPFLELQVTATTTVDLVLFIGAAQCETGMAAPTSPMLPPPGSPAITTRQVESVTYTPPAGALTNAGTMYCEWCAVVGHNGSQAGGIAMQVDTGGTNDRIYMRAASSFASGANGGYGGVAATEPVVVVGGSTVFDPSGTRAIPAENMTLDLDTPIRMACAYGDGQPVTQAFWGQINPDTYAGSLPTGFTRIGATANQSQTFCLTRWRFYQQRLSDARLLGLASDGIAVDPTIAAWDSGWVGNLIAPGAQRAVVVAPAEVVAQCARCDLYDPTNEDGFISIALAYAGPAWQPDPVSVGWGSGWNPQRGGSRVTTRGGQEHVEPLWRRRAWDITLDWISAADHQAHQQPLEETAALAQNILFIPDPADAEGAKRETVFGRLVPTGGVGFPVAGAAARTWQAQIQDRL